MKKNIFFLWGYFVCIGMHKAAFCVGKQPFLERRKKEITLVRTLAYSVDLYALWRFLVAIKKSFGTLGYILVVLYRCHCYDRDLEKEGIPDCFDAFKFVGSYDITYLILNSWEKRGEALGLMLKKLLKDTYKDFLFSFSWVLLSVYIKYQLRTYGLQAA